MTGMNTCGQRRELSEGERNALGRLLGGGLVASTSPCTQQMGHPPPHEAADGARWYDAK